jgi:hypothetical protein
VRGGGNFATISFAISEPDESDPGPDLFLTITPSDFKVLHATGTGDAASS